MDTGVKDVRVRLRDGIEVETQSMGTITFDPSRPAGDMTVVSHAHTDHIPRRKPDAPVVASPLTARLAAERRGWSELPITDHPTIELLPSGHIEGGCAALVRDDGCTILYTGDVCTRDRPGISGFDPVSADVLILEATYGTPDYCLPPVHEVIEDIDNWIDNSDGSPLILYGYAIGRAQRIIRLFEDNFDVTVKTTEAIHRYNEIIAEETGRAFEAALFEPGETLKDDEALVIPNNAARTKWMKQLIDETNAKTAGVTGWAIEQGYRYRRNVDVGFPLSDHCDYNELLELVDDIEPTITYLHHGFTTELARGLTKCGHRTRALVPGQSSLESFW